MRPINRYVSLFGAALLLAAASARATPIYVNNLPLTIFTAGNYNDWSTAVVLPANTYIGSSSSVEVVLNLTGNLTTDSTQTTFSAGAGARLLFPVEPGVEAFGISLQLLEDGVAVGSAFGSDYFNTNSFATNQINFGITGEPNNILFNGVDVLIYNNSSANIMNIFDVEIGVATPSSVPESGATSVMLGSALVCLAAVRRMLARA